MGISLFGNNYQIVDITPYDNVVFGEVVSEKNLVIPGNINIPGKATIELLGIDSISKDIFAKVTFENGTVIFDDFISANTTKSFNDFSFSLNNLRMLTSGLNTVDVDWTSSLITLNNNGNGSVLNEELSDWKVGVNFNSLIFSSPQYDLDTNPIVLTNGEGFNLMDYFSVKFDGFDSTNSTSLISRNIIDNVFSVTLNYENNESESRSVYLGSYIEQAFGTNGLTDYMMLINSSNAYRFRTFQNDSSRFVEVFNQDTTNLSEPLTVLYNSTDANITSFSVNNGVFELTWDEDNMNVTLQSWSESNPKYLSGLSFTNDKLTVTEFDSNTIEVYYNNSDVSKVLVNSLPSSSRELSINSNVNSDFGTLVSNEVGQVILSIVNVRKTANIWYGRMTDGVEAVESEIVSVSPGIGMVDSEINISNIIKPMILVGGDKANILVRDLGISGITEDTAYIRLLEDAFGSGQTVLIVAGYEAKDTRMACQALSAIISGSMELELSENLVWLDTSGDNYSEILVAE